MVCICLGSKSKYYNSFNTDLPHTLKPLRAKELTKFHCKSRRDIFFVSFLIHGMKSDTIFDKNQSFLFWLGYFYDICRGIQVIDIGSSELVLYYLIPIKRWRFCTMAATSREVNRTFVLTFSIWCIIIKELEDAMGWSDSK